MKAIVLMFDSLNRKYLSPYGCDWIETPNFQRLSERAVQFNTSYVCSMPCIPARRDYLTGRPNFLHREWGPIEPFDQTFTGELRKAGIYSHLVTDHYHYWNIGGLTYHTEYDSYELIRGQENDAWIGKVSKPYVPQNINKKESRSYWVNREYMLNSRYNSQTQTIEAGLEFITNNYNDDNWYLQIECFDPHEPFFVEQKYRDAFPKELDNIVFDWPGYCEVTETEDEINEVRRNYAALVLKCDESLGRILDVMDRYELWEDTMLIVWTDHGYLLGEHNWWAKNLPPLYDEIARTPFFVWNPKEAKSNVKRSSLVQPAIDLAPTILEYFEVNKPDSMKGLSLNSVVGSDNKIREAAIFGYFGQGINITDGRCVYMHPSTRENEPLYSYTMMPMNFRSMMDPRRLRMAELVDPLSYTQRMPILRIPSSMKSNEHTSLAMGFDTDMDPGQLRSMPDSVCCQRLKLLIPSLMHEADAPEEQWIRLGL